MSKRTYKLLQSIQSLLALLTLVLISQSALASVSPFKSTNQNPLITIYGLPAIETNSIPEKHSMNLWLNYYLVNNSQWSKGTNEELLVDGETQTFDITAMWGISEKLAIGINIPHVIHSPGNTDYAIKKWHDALRLSNEKHRLPYSTLDELNYYYFDGQQNNLNITHFNQGIGDITVSMAYQLQNNLEIHTGIELPTGNYTQLHGSGSYDAYIYASGTKENISSSKHSLYGGAGLLFTGNGEVLNQIKRHWISFTNIGYAYFINQAVTFKLQADLHSSFYKSDIEQLGDSSTQITIGGNIKFNNFYYIDFALLENISLDSTPDIALLVTLGRLNWK